MAGVKGRSGRRPTPEKNKKEYLNIRLNADTKKTLRVLSEGTQAKTITSVIESFVKAYKSGKITSGDLELKRR